MNAFRDALYGDVGLAGPATERGGDKGGDFVGFGDGGCGGRDAVEVVEGEVYYFRPFAGVQGDGTCSLRRYCY